MNHYYHLIINNNFRIIDWYLYKYFCRYFCPVKIRFYLLWRLLYCQYLHLMRTGHLNIRNCRRLKLHLAVTFHECTCCRPWLWAHCRIRNPGFNSAHSHLCLYWLWPVGLTTLCFWKWVNRGSWHPNISLDLCQTQWPFCHCINKCCGPVFSRLSHCWCLF